MKIQLSEILTKNMFTASLQVNCCDLHDDNEVINFETHQIIFNINKRQKFMLVSKCFDVT